MSAKKKSNKPATDTAPATATPRPIVSRMGTLFAPGTFPLRSIGGLSTHAENEAAAGAATAAVKTANAALTMAMEADKKKSTASTTAAVKTATKTLEAANKAVANLKRTITGKRGSLSVGASALGESYGQNAPVLITDSSGIVNLVIFNPNGLRLLPLTESSSRAIHSAPFAVLSAKGSGGLSDLQKYLNQHPDKSVGHAWNGSSKLQKSEALLTSLKAAGVLSSGESPVKLTALAALDEYRANIAEMEANPGYAQTPASMLPIIRAMCWKCKTLSLSDAEAIEAEASQTDTGAFNTKTITL